MSASRHARLAGLLCALTLAACDDDPAKPAAGDAAPTDAAVVVDAAPDAAADAGPADAAVDAAAPDAALTPEQARVVGVPELDRRVLAGLEAPVHVIETELGVPHLYASNRRDLARVHGFIFGRDRFWMIDLARRLALGRLSELVGDVLIDTDIASRAQGLPQAAERLLASLSPERRAELDAFAEGVNAYVEAAKAGELPIPSEMKVAGPLLGSLNAAELLEPLSTLDVLAFAAVVLEQSTCGKDEVQRTAALLDTYGAFDDVPTGALHEAGLRDDIFYRVEPLANVFTVGGPQAKASFEPVRSPLTPPLRLPKAWLARTAEALARWPGRRGGAVGSNAWAVSGAHTTDGATLLAGDGHLPLAVPAYFHQAGLDTAVFGGDDWHARGNFIAGLPALGVGTNGKVAWSFTCFYSDTVDWYREEIRLGADGWPEATRFGEEWKPLNRVDETYHTRAVVVLMSPGGDVVQPRYELFDGRRLMAVEGRPAEPGEAGLNLGTGAVIPGDVDGDGVITGLAMDATYLDVGDAIGAYYDLANAQNLNEFRDTQRKLAVFGSHFVAADVDGHLLATGYHAAPCRGDLARTEDGRRFADGDDPQVVMDGTRHGGFTLRYTPDGRVDEANADPAACVVPFEQFPHAVDPPSGYVVSANNDPSGLSRDGSLADDDIYIGGPWSIALRAARIDALVAAAAAAGTADVETMARIQADTRSSAGALFAPYLLEVLADTRALLADPVVLEGADARVGERYTADRVRFEAVEARLQAWVAADFPTPSGVETFYHAVAPGEAELSVATTLFNAWLGHFVEAVLADERMTPGSRMTDDQAMGRALANLVFGRGADNPRGLASFDPATGESALFDDLSTPEIERSDEIALAALSAALDFLESEPSAPGEGGYGTPDMDAWRWGLRHQVRFESILAPFVGGVGGFGAIISRFGIEPSALPLAGGPLPEGDPRRGLKGFPRGGDNYAVDAADSDLRPRDFTYRNGPVKRMVIALHPDGRVSGQNIIPGGQSGLTDSPHFADQAALWLGNQAIPLRFHLDEVVEGAVGRHVYLPR
ncbi:MAG: penicillin acylase family protein [Myxococcales bacterium]|nr:penicillin acylase family protein [Myxococcales bacterium]